MSECPGIQTADFPLDTILKAALQRILARVGDCDGITIANDHAAFDKAFKTGIGSNGRLAATGPIADFVPVPDTGGGSAPHAIWPKARRKGLFGRKLEPNPLRSGRRAVWKDFFVCRTVASISLPLLLLLAVVLAAAPVAARADVALLMEEPYGEFGAYNPTGHAAVFLSDICAETPTRLRRCGPGEFGSVISRYHKIHGEDWIAVPLVPYLYGVETPAQIPDSVTREQVVTLREAYWRAHLQTMAPPAKDGSAPKGEWPQLVGSSFDRTILGFTVHSTTGQDDRFIAFFNDRRNVGHFNLFFHNCADFSRVVLDTFYPGAIHRNLFADFGMTTPKAAARSLVQYGRKHPELHPTTFEIAQVPGQMPRSGHIEGVSESLVKSKKYLIPLAILQPEVAGAIAADFLTRGRARLPRTATAFAVKAWEIPDHAAPAPPPHPGALSAANLGE